MYIKLKYFIDMEIQVYFSLSYVFSIRLFSHDVDMHLVISPPFGTQAIVMRQIMLGKMRLFALIVKLSQHMV